VSDLPHAQKLWMYQLYYTVVSGGSDKRNVTSFRFCITVRFIAIYHLRYRSNFQYVVEVGQEGPQYEDIVIMAAPGTKYSLQDFWILTVAIGSTNGAKLV